MKDYVVLTGGTRFHAKEGRYARLSRDLDWNQTHHLGSDIFAEGSSMRLALESAGICLDVTGPEGTYNMSFEHPTHGKGIAQVKWDVRDYSSPLLWEPLLIDLDELAGIGAKDIPVVILEEAMGGKTWAALDRGLARDMFDLSCFPRIPDVNWRKVQITVAVQGVADNCGTRTGSSRRLGCAASNRFGSSWESFRSSRAPSFTDRLTSKRSNYCDAPARDWSAYSPCLPTYRSSS